MDRKYTVYIHHNLINHKVYVGITCKKDPNSRWQNGKGYKEHNPHFYAAIEKYGWNNFEHIIYARDIPEESAYEIEKELIALYHSNENEHGYNKSSGGEISSVIHGLSGTKEYEQYYKKHVSPEQKERNKLLIWFRNSYIASLMTEEQYKYYHENTDKLRILYNNYKGYTISKCKDCGEEFATAYNSHKYCPNCRLKQKERDKECRKRMKEKHKEERKKHIEEIKNIKLKELFNE